MSESAIFYFKRKYKNLQLCFILHHIKIAQEEGDFKRATSRLSLMMWIFLNTV